MAYKKFHLTTYRVFLLASVLILLLVVLWGQLIALR